MFKYIGLLLDFVLFGFQLFDRHANLHFLLLLNVAHLAKAQSEVSKVLYEVIRDLRELRAHIVLRIDNGWPQHLEVLLVSLKLMPQRLEHCLFFVS